MLSLRQFDSSLGSATGPQLREHAASTVLQFGAHPSDSLPASIASFAHPVSIGAGPSEPEVGADEIVDNVSEEREVDMETPGQSERARAFRQSLTLESRPAEFAEDV